MQALRFSFCFLRITHYALRFMLPIQMKMPVAKSGAGIFPSSSEIG
jgi:hypothetical protein